MSVVRIVARATIDNPDSPPIYLDLSVGKEGAVIGKRAAFGFQGELDRNSTQECCPFILYSDGSIDFGSGYDTAVDERRALTNILDNPIKVGSLFHWESKIYGTYHYKVSELHPAD